MLLFQVSKASHPQAKDMNPYEWFQGVTQLPKPVNTQSLMGFSTQNNPKFTISLLSILHYPKKMNPLENHAVP
jgi:hypothetical protein